MTELERLMGLPYTISIKLDDEGDFIASVVELPGCITHAESEQDALVRIRQAQRAWLAAALKAEKSIPAPAESVDDLPSGKWLQRVPRSLHGRLIREAARENTSLNQLVAGFLAEAISAREVLRESDPHVSHGYNRSWRVGATPKVSTQITGAAGSIDRMELADQLRSKGVSGWKNDDEHQVKK